MTWGRTGGGRTWGGTGLVSSRPEASAARLRLSVLGIIVISLFVALFARLVYLQVIDSSRLASAAVANQARTVDISAPRGRILDRNGRVLVASRDVDEVTIDRVALRQNPQIVAKLAMFLGVTQSELQRRIDTTQVSPYRPIPVAQAVDKNLIASLRERQDEFPGVSADTTVQRWYPNGSLAAHVLGYVGEINDKELAAHRQAGYQLSDDIGKSGIEAAYEQQLRGTPGVEKLEVDSSGRTVRVLQSTPPVPGHDVQLTLDLNLQQTAETALAQGLAAARTNGGQGGGLSAPAGSVVALDPADGSILAMASYPTFDPSQFAGGISTAAYAQLTDPQGGQPLTNRAIQGQYAPGSTFKLFTSVAALRTGLISPGTVINDTGSFTLGNRSFRNAQGRVYGPLALSKALTVSSDVFFYTLGDRFWQSRSRLGDPVQAEGRNFGLGSKLGLSLGGEAPGRLLDPNSLKALHQQNPGAFPEANWYPGDNVNMAIGQGDTLVTPLQLADAYATFANGGTLRQPRLVDQVVDSSGKVLSRPQAQTIRQVDLPASIRQPIEQGLVGAVQDPHGTAAAAFSGFDFKAFPVAGKTGTAQVTGKGDSAVFAAYGPVGQLGQVGGPGQPQIAVSVVLEQAGFGGSSAAPVGRRVMAAAAGQSTRQGNLGNGVD